jgi:hypothetical protein
MLVVEVVLRPLQEPEEAEAVALAQPIPIQQEALLPQILVVAAGEQERTALQLYPVAQVALAS